MNRFTPTQYLDEQWLGWNDATCLSPTPLTLRELRLPERRIRSVRPLQKKPFSSNYVYDLVTMRQHGNLCHHL